MTPAFRSTRTLCTADLERLCDFYVYVFDGRCCVRRFPPTGRRAALVDLPHGQGTLLLVEMPGPRAAPPVVALDCAAGLAWARRRLICLVATDGMVREVGGCNVLDYRDPDGPARLLSPVRQVGRPYRCAGTRAAAR
ncbi:MAG: hypothetical protein ACKVWR_21030 [Acidimicrobiales bacterium]